jgi:hypothetical protein
MASSSEQRDSTNDREKVKKHAKKAREKSPGKMHPSAEDSSNRRKSSEQSKKAKKRSKSRENTDEASRSHSQRHAEHESRKPKKAKSNHKDKVIHDLSDSNDEDTQFLGFRPVFATSQSEQGSSSTPACPVNPVTVQLPQPTPGPSAATQPAVPNNTVVQLPQPTAGPSTSYMPQHPMHMAMMQHNPMPAWLNAASPPGPWQYNFPYYPQGPSQVPPPTQSQTPYDYAFDESDHTSDSDSDSETDSEYEELQEIPQATNSAAQAPSAAVPPVPAGQPLQVSLEKHIKAVQQDTEVGDPVSPQLALIVEGLWSKENKPEIKAIYEQIKKPENTPSVQTVDLNREFAMQLGSNPKDYRGTKIKKLDWQLRSVNTAFAKAACNLTRLANISATAQPGDDIRQLTTDKVLETIQILSYGSQLLHPIRRANVKPRLAPSTRSQLCKSTLEDTNKSHQLFGSDVQKQAKEGNYSMQYSIVDNLMSLYHVKLQLIPTLINIIYDIAFQLERPRH